MNLSSFAKTVGRLFSEEEMRDGAGQLILGLITPRIVVTIRTGHLTERPWKGGVNRAILCLVGRDDTRGPIITLSSVSGALASGRRGRVADLRNQGVR